MGAPLGLQRFPVKVQIMKLVIPSLLAALCMTTAANAQDDPVPTRLYISWDEAVMRQALELVGLEVLNEGVQNGEIVMSAGAGNVRIGVRGTVCEGEPLTCRGAQLFSFFNPDIAADADAALGDTLTVNHDILDDGRLLVSRYVIFDNGITVGNLASNISLLTYNLLQALPEAPAEAAPAD